MKKKLVLPVLAILLLSFASCLKDGDETIKLNDNQDIPFITEFLPFDLLSLYGEENVFFGDVPPKVELQFKSNHEYVATNLQPPYCPPIGGVTPVTHFHFLTNQNMQMADYYSMSSEEEHCHLITPVYLTGHVTTENDSLFTAYYMENAEQDVPLYVDKFLRPGMMYYSHRHGKEMLPQPGAFAEALRDGSRKYIMVRGLEYRRLQKNNVKRRIKLYRK